MAKKLSFPSLDDDEIAAPAPGQTFTDNAAYDFKALDQQVDREALGEEAFREVVKRRREDH